jgi:excisionase family DNA binding protein
MTRNTSDAVLKLREAADLLKLKGKTVLQLATTGRLPGRCVEGEWRFSRTAILEWLSGREEAQMPPVFEIVLPDNRPKVFRSRPTHPKLATEHDAFLRMLPDLLSRYAGKYVAIHDAQVVAVGVSEVATLTAAHQANPGTLVLVRLVTDQPQPVERIPTFRPVPAG